ncbi:MAG: hypothetical protein ACI9U2_004432 [Bradymonadia bacterium]|jgi:hypothetical protein
MNRNQALQSQRPPTDARDSQSTAIAHAAAPIINRGRLRAPSDSVFLKDGPFEDHQVKIEGDALLIAKMLAGHLLVKAP